MAQKQGRQGMVVVYTGDGKGKTTAAVGTLLRAWGRDMKVTAVHFMSKTGSKSYGEIRAAERLGWEWTTIGGGFTWLSTDLERDKALARQAWDLARERINSGQYDFVLLDEMTYLLNYGWLSVDDVIAALRARPDHVHVIITGRDAPRELIDFADLVTEMQEIKHPYHKGIPGQPGLDW